MWHAEISRFLHGLTRVPKRINFIDLQASRTRGFLHRALATSDGARCAALIIMVLMADVAGVRSRSAPLSPHGFERSAFQFSSRVDFETGPRLIFIGVLGPI